MTFPYYVDTTLEEEYVTTFLWKENKFWRTRKEVNKSLMLKFTTTMATPLMRAQMFRNAAEKNIFFIVKNEYGQTVALTREDGCAALVVAFPTVNQSKSPEVGSITDVSTETRKFTALPNRKEDEAIASDQIKNPGSVSSGSISVERLFHK